MEKTVIGLVAAIGAVTPFATAQAAPLPQDPTAALNVGSLAELFDPVPNAASILAALDAEKEAKPAREATKGVVLAWHHHHWHHHHWHHHHWHHHHWHHHHWHDHYYGGGGVGCWPTPLGWVCP